MEPGKDIADAPENQAPEVVISAVTLSGNKGAEGMFWALYEGVSAKFPQARFHVATYYPKIDRERTPERVSVVSSTPKALVGKVFVSSLLYGLFRKVGIKLPKGMLPGFPRAIARSQVLLDAAGVSFSDGREKFLPFNILTMLPAVLLGTPAIKCSQALGPFKGRINRGAAGWFLPKLQRVFARGGQTLRFVEDLGRVEVSLASDLVFNLKPQPLPPGLKLPRAPEGGLLVGISPSSLVESKCRKRGLDYCGTLAAFIHTLIREGRHRVLLVPHSIRLDSEEARNNDLPTCRRVAALLGDAPGCTVVDQELLPAQLKTVVASCDYFLASRFHSMVAALSGQVPLLVCGWGHKYLEVLDEFDLGEWAFDFSELCFETLQERFNRLLDQGGAVREKIAANLPRVKEQSSRQMEYICELLGEISLPPAPG